MGELLKKEGYSNLTASDISHEMLKKAQEKNLYQDFFQADLTEKINKPNESFESIVSIGVSGYMKNHSINELVRILKVDGFLIYTISDDHFKNAEFDQVVEELKKENSIKVLEKTDTFLPLPKSHSTHLARVHIYQKIKKWMR